MALFTSENGYFQVTALSFSPRVITVGEETAYSITIKNTSGKKITKMYATLALYYPDAQGRVSKSTAVYVHGSYGYEMASISWAANASKTFMGTFKFTTSSASGFEPDITTRLMPVFDADSYTGGQKRGMILQITTDATFANGTNYDNFYNLRGDDSAYLAVIDAYYNPKISIFTAERCEGGVENDEGENLMVSLKARLPGDAVSDGFTMKLYYAKDTEANTASPSIDLTASVPAALTGITSSTTLISQTFDKASDWGLMIVFGDEYESTAASADLARAFANMHLSGCDTGGVCFGGFSTSEEGAPKLESRFPFYPYGGIEPTETIYPTLRDGLSTPGDYGGTLVFRRIGSIVIVSGSVKLTSETAQTVICDLPESCIPANSHYYIGAMTGSQIARLAVYGSGEEVTNPGTLALDWVKKTNSTTSVSSTQSWIDCSTVYWVN